MWRYYIFLLTHINIHICKTVTFVQKQGKLEFTNKISTDYIDEMARGVARREVDCRNRSSSSSSINEWSQGKKMLSSRGACIGIGWPRPTSSGNNATANDWKAHIPHTHAHNSRIYRCKNIKIPTKWCHKLKAVRRVLPWYLCMSTCAVHICGITERNAVFGCPETLYHGSKIEINGFILYLSRLETIHLFSYLSVFVLVYTI